MARGDARAALEPHAGAGQHATSTATRSSSAEEALEYGLIDQVLTTRKSLPALDPVARPARTRRMPGHAAAPSAAFGVPRPRSSRGSRSANRDPIAIRARHAAPSRSRARLGTDSSTGRVRWHASVRAPTCSSAPSAERARSRSSSSSPAPASTSATSASSSATRSSKSAWPSPARPTSRRVRPAEAAGDLRVPRGVRRSARTPRSARSSVAVYNHYKRVRAARTITVGRPARRRGRDRQDATSCSSARPAAARPTSRRRSPSGSTCRSPSRMPRR